MPTANDYRIDWRRHRGAVGIGGVTTHAVLDGSEGKTVCGIVPGGDGGNFTLTEAGDVGCGRCRKILTAASVLPLPARTE